MYTDGVPAKRVLVVFESSPAHYAVECGRVLPEPGEDAAQAHRDLEARRTHGSTVLTP